MRSRRRSAAPPRASRTFRVTGFTLLILIFWAGWGWWLGGDAYLFGPYIKWAQVTSPVAVVGLLTAFLTMAFTDQLRTRKSEIYAGLGLLLALSLSALFAARTYEAFAVVALWAVGILGLGFAGNWSVPDNRKTWVAGILAGTVWALVDPSAQVAMALVSLVGILFSMSELGRTYHDAWTISGLLLAAFATWLSGSLPLGFIHAGVLILSPLWLKSWRRGHFQLSTVTGALAVLAGLWAYSLMANGFPPWPRFAPLGHMVSDPLYALFGAGGRHYTNVLQAAAETFLLPSEMSLPATGLGYFLVEFGLVGLISFGVFLSSMRGFWGSKLVIALALFFVPELLANETTWLFLPALLVLRLTEESAGPRVIS